LSYAYSLDGLAIAAAMRRVREGLDDPFLSVLAARFGSLLVTTNLVTWQYLDLARSR